MASTEKFSASGGADDRIIIYDLEKRREIDDLYIHDGTVNSLTFSPDGNYLISGGADGKIAFTKTNTWKLDKVLERAHKGSSVNHISIHPSGKLAISMGSDQTLRTWNLITGRQAHATSLKNKPNLGGAVEVVEWSESGKYFGIVGKNSVEIWETESGEVIRTQKCDSKPTCLCWISDEDVFVGLENGSLLFFNLQDEDDEEVLCEIYDGRIKAMDYIDGYLVTASSSGELNLWQIIKGDKVEIDMVCGIQVGCRIICLSIVKHNEDSNFNNLEIKKEEIEYEELAKTEVKKLKTSGSVTVEVEGSAKKIKDKKKNSKKKDKRKSDIAFKEEENASNDEKLCTPVSSKKTRKSMIGEFLEEDL